MSVVNSSFFFTGRERNYINKRVVGCDEVDGAKPNGRRASSPRDGGRLERGRNHRLPGVPGDDETEI